MRRGREGDRLRWISRLSWFAGRNADAEEAAAAALAVLEPLEPGRELAMALSDVGQLRTLDDDVDGAIEWGGRAIVLAERLGDVDTLVHALNNVGTAEWLSGRDRAKLERSLALALEHGLEEHVARAYTNLGACAVRTHDFRQADSYLGGGIDFSARHDLDSWRLYMLGWRALAALARGLWDAAAEDAETVLADPETPPPSQIQALAARCSSDPIPFR